MPRLAHDVRLITRQFSKNPGFAAMVICCLGLGMGATAAIFSLVHAVVLRPLPFPEPDRLVWLQLADHTPGSPPNASASLSYPDYFDWRCASRSFDGIASYRNNTFVLTGIPRPQQLQGATVSSNFFRVLGVRPRIGRDFVPEEEKPGTHVAMLSHALWQSTFGGAEDIAGRSIVLDGVSYTVAGVMPEGFGFPIRNPAPAIWTTLAQDGEGSFLGSGNDFLAQRGANLLDVVGRLKPRMPANGARAELDVVARQNAAQYPDSDKYYNAAFVEPMMEHVVGAYRPALRVLFAAVLCLLLIACANIAGLLLVKASRQAPEIAIRIALGASRAEIARQVLVESVLLGLGGGALGILFSSWILGAMVSFVPQDIPRLTEIGVDPAVLVFVLAVSLLTGILFGVAPAWRAASLDPASAMNEAGRGTIVSRGRSRLHTSIVIGEAAIGLVLLAGSGLLIRSFVNVLRVDPGFDPRHVLTASINLPDKTYPSAQKVQFYDHFLPRLAALPGVQSVAAGWPLPLAQGGIEISFGIEGKPVPSSDEPNEHLAVVTAGFFQTMRIPVLAGREFTTRDVKQSTPVVLINQQFARKYFPGENPLGKHIRPGLSDGDGKKPMREVVGIVGDVKRSSLIAATEPMYYLPWAQEVITSPALCIRTAADPAQLAGVLRAELAKLDPDIPLYRVRTLDSLVRGATAAPRFQMLLVTTFALLALGLAAVGLYAVLSYMVAQRTLEIGLRMALGAQPADVLRWVLRRGLAMAALGIAIGLGATVAVTRYMQELLFGVRPLDGLTLAAVTLALLVVSAAASAAPAWRAARLDPMEALRQQ